MTGTFPEKNDSYKRDSLFFFLVNYRPIITASVLEDIRTIFHDKLDIFIEKYNVLSESRYGFRTNKSTLKRNNCYGVFIDLKKITSYYSKS